MGRVGEGRRQNADQTGFNRRFTVPEAAQVLGISPEAVRTRLSRGTLESVRDGGRVFVLLDRDLTSSDTDVTHDQTVLVDTLRDQIDTLKRQLEQANERDRENRRIIAALTSRIPELPPAADSAAAEAPQAPTGGTEQPGRVEP
jgi:hypothetical protein